MGAPLPGGTLPGGIPPGGTLPGSTAPSESGGVPGGSPGEVPEAAVEGSSEASRHNAAAWFDPDTRFRVTLPPPLPLYNDNEEVFGYNQSAKHFFGTCFLLFVAAVLTLVLSHLFTPLIGMVSRGERGWYLDITWEYVYICESVCVCIIMHVKCGVLNNVLHFFVSM